MKISLYEKILIWLNLKKVCLCGTVHNDGRFLCENCIRKRWVELMKEIGHKHPHLRVIKNK